MHAEKPGPHCALDSLSGLRSLLRRFARIQCAPTGTGASLERGIHVTDSGIHDVTVEIPLGSAARQPACVLIEVVPG